VDLKLIKKKTSASMPPTISSLSKKEKIQDAFPVSMSTTVTKEFDTAGFRYRNRGKGCKK